VIQNLYHDGCEKFKRFSQFDFQKMFFYDKYNNIYLCLYNLFINEKKSDNFKTLKYIIDLINDSCDFINKQYLLNYYNKINIFNCINKFLFKIDYKKEEEYFVIKIFTHSSNSSIEVDTKLKDESIINIKIKILKIKKEKYFKRIIKQNIIELNNNNNLIELNFEYKNIQIISFKPEIENKKGIILIKYKIIKNSLL